MITTEVEGLIKLDFIVLGIRLVNHGFKMVEIFLDYKKFLIIAH